jgi:hypothetical protein
MNMHLVADTGVQPKTYFSSDPFYSTALDSVLPANFEIDYIRAYSSQGNEFMWQWGNAGSDKISGWDMNTSDKFIVGDFAGLGRDQLLAVNTNTHWAVLMQYSSGNWYGVWDNKGTDKISGWNMNPGDQFIVGDFAGLGTPQLLSINANTHWAVLMQYSAGNWSGIWDNKGSDKIHWWYMNPTDKYLVGNFDGGTRSQILAVATNGWSHLMSYSGPDWETPWSNDGGAIIDLWYMHSSDSYFAGDFDGKGHADLFAVAGNGWAQLMQRMLP